MDSIAPLPLHSSLPTLSTLLETERSIAEGATNLLSVFDSNNQASGSAGNEDLKIQVELELEAAKERIDKLETEIRVREVGNEAPTSIRSRTPFSTSPTNHSQFKISPISPDFLAYPPPSVQTEISMVQTTYEVIMMMIFKLDQLQEEGQEGIGGNSLVVVKHMDAIVVLLASHARVRFELKLEDLLTPILKCLSEKSGKEIRASTYRLLRHLIVDQHDVNQLQTRYFDLFLVRSLARDSKHELEKEQALRLVRHLLNLPDADRPVPSSVIRAIISIAEATDERLRLACLETLGELLIRDIPLLIHSEGLRVILQTLSDGPHDLSPYLALGFLWVMDRPGTRDYLRPGVDIEIILAGFTEVHVKSTSQEERVRTSAKIITQLLQSWTGLMYLSLNEKQAIRSLVDSLTTPSTSVREILLDTLVNIFQIKTPSWYKSTHSRRGGQATTTSLSPPLPSHSEKTNLVDQYLAILLLVFIEAGLLEALVSVAANSKVSISAPKVSFLIGEILQLSTRVLPLSYAARVQALPKLFSLASSFDTSDARLAATYTLGAVDEYNRKGFRNESGIERTRERSNSIEEGVKRGQRHFDSIKMRQALQLDDASFRNLLLETQILTTKTHTKWSIETMQEMLEGPLLNPKRLDEAMRASKFVSRLLAFFQPLNYRYSELKKNSDNAKYTKLGCTLLTTLLANPDGIRFLTEEKLIRHIADCLIQLHTSTATPTTEVLLSKHRMERTIVGGYFEMLGTLTKSTEGMKLLEQNKVFTSFYRISDLSNREDLIAAILENVDYTRDGHSRVLLSKALTSTHKSIRIYATRHLTKLSQESSLVPEWQIRLLLTQLYDTSIEICEMVVKVLEVICETLSNLEVVVRMRPSLDHLGEIGAVLLTRFLSTPVGVGYLQEIDFIDRELDDWFNHRNSLYVVQVELLLASVLKLDTSSETSFDGTPPPHFYSDLVKTEEGCLILDESGHFLEFADFIRQHGLEDFDSEIIGQLKSALWAVGHIGSSEKGLPFLELEDIVMSIVEIAEDSPVYSLRGTACFVLGLISSTLEGVEILDELGWESVVTPLGRAVGLCVPRVISNLVDTPSWSVPTADIPESLSLGSPTNHLEREALTAFANLSNHILASKASKSLSRLKSHHRQLFSSPSLFYRALEMLKNHHYRLSVRRYILEMFDLGLDFSTVALIEAAGEELRAKKIEEGENGNGQNGSGWNLFGERINGGGERGGKGGVEDILKGIEGDLTDEDNDDEEGSLHGEEGNKIPLQVLSPLLRVKGFIC